MLAEAHKTNIFDIKSYFVPQTQYRAYSVNEKTKMLFTNLIEKTFFIYESDNFIYYWNIFLSRHSNYSTNVKIKS